jgi:hypothetical protein
LDVKVSDHAPNATEIALLLMHTRIHQRPYLISLLTDQDISSVLTREDIGKPLSGALLLSVEKTNYARYRDHPADLGGR